MKILKNIILFIAIGFCSSVWAGPYADELGKKLVSTTAAEEKALFVRWMFVAMSLHPDLKDMSSITLEQREEANRKVGELLTRMLTVTCAAEAKEAIKYEGVSAMQSAFQLFGQIAARELFTNKEVTKGMADLEKYFDAEKIKKTLE